MHILMQSIKEYQGAYRMKSNETRSRNNLILAMCVFGTVGIFRRYIDLPSSLIALVRGIIGTLVLVTYMGIRRKKLDAAAVKKNFPLLLLSGAAIGFNWIFLFEAYNYTTVATATLCYYLAPILVILAAPFVIGEKLTLRKALCALTALIGMVFVSGILEPNDLVDVDRTKGILFGIAAAVLYASVILINKKMAPIPALDKTMFQLGFASLALVPYILLTVSAASLSCNVTSAVLLLIMGAFHTGISYLLYFGSMGDLKAHTVALFSYIDPVLAIILSALLLKEPMTIWGILGAVMILGAALVSEISNE